MAVRADAAEKGFAATARWAWRDLVAHWKRPQPAGATLWPLWLAIFLLALALIYGDSRAFDVTEALAVRSYNPHLVHISRYVTRAGKSDWLFASSILCLLYALYRRAGAATARLRAAYGLLASRAFYFVSVQAFSGILSQIVKHIVGRARPHFIYTLGPYHFDFFSIKASLASFPSGHTTSIFAAAACMSFFLPRLAPLFYFLALPVAVSRLILGAHYPSDVLAGAFLGVGSAYAVARFYARRKIVFTIARDGLWPRLRKSPVALVRDKSAQR